MDALLRRRAMIAAGGSPTPPVPVVSVPYIRGGGDGSYIDTGITADNTVKVIIWARNFNPTCGFLFGSRIGTRDNNYGLGSHTGANTGSIRLDYAQELSYVQDQFVILSGYHKYEVYQGVVKVDDTAIGSITETSFSNAYSIHLLGMNTAGTHTAMTLPADICACKIYKGGVLVRDYTPANSPSVGLYDAVSDTVFTNAGSGSFSYGSFNENAYIPLECVTCSGEQYFDTGLKGGYAVPWVCVFTPTGTTARISYPVGAQTTSSSKKCAIGIGNTTYVNGRLYFSYQSDSNAVKSTNTNNYFTNKKIVYVKSNNVATAYVNNAQEGTVTGTSGSSFETDYTLYVGALNDAGTNADRLIGNIFYCGLGTNRNYVPAKVNGVAGMYDTYNDVFKPSISGTDFIAGTEL